MELEQLFKPDSIAVIGASAKPGKIGHAVLTNIQNTFKGSIYPVNPRGGEINGLKAYKSITEVKADLAVITVPGKFVHQVLKECGEAGVKYVIIISAGFKEIGAEGKKLEQELVKTAKEYGIRMVGPNVVGVIDSSTPMNASFSHIMSLPGHIGFMSQSGALCLAILDWANSIGMGFSKFISLGNKADLNEADFIEALAKDPDTNVIGGYIEDVVDGDRFLKVAREAARKKPIIFLKSGTSESGAKAASSHTGALAGSDRAYETAFKQIGILRTRTMTELFDLAKLLANQPLPTGRKVGVLTNAGGLGIVATDAIENKGLKMATFTEATYEKLEANLPIEANTKNPVDVLGDTTPDRFEFALEQVIQDANVDQLLVMLCPTAVQKGDEIAEIIIRQAKKQSDKPVQVVFVGGEALEEGRQMLEKAGIPTYVFPEGAVDAMVKATEYAEFLKTPVEDGLGDYEVDKDKVKEIFKAVKEDNRKVLLGTETAQVAEAYGVPAAPSRLCGTADEAVAFAEEVGYPLVLKIASPEILHKTDIGGVKLKLETPDQVREGFHEIMKSVKEKQPDAKIYGIEAQKMMPAGQELIVGMSSDPQFGPMVMFGLGGIYVNLLKDVSFRLANGLSQREIRQMVEEIQTYPLLSGYRGAKPKDIDAICDVIARVATLVTDFREISELDINPVFVYEDGILAVDMKIKLG